MQDGGEGIFPSRPFSSSLQGTGLLSGTVKSNTGLFGGEKKGDTKVTAGRRQPTFIQGRVFFLSKKMP